MSGCAKIILGVIVGCILGVIVGVILATVINLISGVCGMYGTCGITQLVFGFFGGLAGIFLGGIIIGFRAIASDESELGEKAKNDEY